MSDDYLKSLKYLGLISRIKRLSDKTMASGRALYKQIDIGIEPNWFLIFSIIIEKESSTISEIASILNFAHPSVISIVQKMVKNGYLELSNDDVDKRKQIIRLTEKATQQLPEMKKVWEACEKGVQSIFDDDTFLHELARIEDAFEQVSFSERALSLLNADVRLVPFEDSHAKDFANLNREWIEKFFELEENDLKVLNNPKAQILKKGGQIIMATISKNAVGTIALIPINDSEQELARMAVSPKYQGRGVGHKLMKAVIESAQEKKVNNLVLYTNSKLKSAIHLYKKHGFKKVKMNHDESYKRADIKMRLAL